MLQGHNTPTTNQPAIGNEEIIIKSQKQKKKKKKEVLGTKSAMAGGVMDSFETLVAELEIYSGLLIGVCIHGNSDWVDHKREGLYCW